MSTLRAYLGVAGLVDVGFRLYTQNTPAGPRTVDGVLDEGMGWYSVAGVSLVGDHVRWDSNGTPSAVAREDLALLIAAQGLTSDQLSLIGTAVWATVARTLTGAVVLPTSPPPGYGITADEAAQLTSISAALAAAQQILLAELYVPVPGPVQTVPAPLVPAGVSTGHLSVAAKLRWLPKAPADPMTIKNFEALRLMMQAIMLEKADKLNDAEILQSKAVKTLEEELREYLAGQQITLPAFSTFGLNELGGVR